MTRLTRAHVLKVKGKSLAAIGQYARPVHVTAKCLWTQKTVIPCQPAGKEKSCRLLCIVAEHQLTSNQQGFSIYLCGRYSKRGQFIFCLMHTQQIKDLRKTIRKCFQFRAKLGIFLVLKWLLVKSTLDYVFELEIK